MQTAAHYRKNLRELTGAVSIVVRFMDQAMKLPVSPARGKLIARIMNQLDMANDIASHFGLGRPLTAGKDTSVRFHFFESTEGGMETHPALDLTALLAALPLGAHGDKLSTSERRKVTQWAERAMPGDLFAWRRGAVVATFNQPV